VNGPAVYITSTASDSEVYDVAAVRTNLGTDIDGVDWTAWGAFFDNGPNTTLRNLSIKSCGGPGVQFYDSSRNAVLDGFLIRDPLRKMASGNKAAVLVTVNVATPIEIRNGRIACSDTAMDYGVYQASTLTQTRIRGCDISNENTLKISTAYTLAVVRGNSGLNELCTGQDTAVTIVSDAIDISKANSSSFALLGEGGAADNLSTITGGRDGDRICLRRGAGVAITIKHGTGNTMTNSGTDFVLSGTFTRIEMRREGANWVQC
jgi:hypothetical protein